MLETDRPSVLRQAIQSVRKGGTVSIPGVYGGLLDKVPFGVAFAKGLTRGLQFFFSRKTRQSEDSVREDEELFI